MQRIPWNKGLRNGIIRKCPSCNCEIYTTKSRDKKFCSKKCYGLFYCGKKLSEEHIEKLRVSKIGELNPQFGKKRSQEWKDNMSKRVSGKNNPFYGKKHSKETMEKLRKKGHWYKKGHVPYLKGKEHKQESIEKLKKSLKKAFPDGRSGENNPTWNGGTSTYMELIRGQLNSWRKAVFKRDNYTCQECGKRGGLLNAHHIIYVSECIALDWEEEIFDIDNGLTLCKEHHDNIHF